MSSNGTPPGNGSPTGNGSAAGNDSPARSGSAAGNGLRFIWGTLTVLPTPAPKTLAAPVPAWAMCLAPIPAFVLACAATAVASMLSSFHAPALVCGAAAIATLMVLSRGLHLDGLADTLDGVGASYVKQRALEVMRTPDTGPIAVAGLVLVLLAQVACCAALLPYPHILVLALMAGRMSLGLSAASWWSPARSDGLGAPVIGSVPGIVAVLTTLGWTALTDFVLTFLGVHSLGAIFILLAAFLTTIVVNIWLSRTIGGLTGDTLGANIELTTLVALIVTTTYI